MDIIEMTLFGEKVEQILDHEGGNPCGLVIADEVSLGEEELMVLEVPASLLIAGRHLRQLLQLKIENLPSDYRGYNCYWFEYTDEHGKTHTIYPYDTSELFSKPH